MGKPIEFAFSSTPEEVKSRMLREVHDLIRAHQRLPGSIIRGILQRLFQFHTTADASSKAKTNFKSPLIF